MSACADDGANGDDDAASEAGDGDGDGAPGDGDGEPGDGDGEPGDGDGEPGDGDGEPGDGDGEPGDGDGAPGDGDGEPGDGDGEPNLCASTLESCDALKAAFAAETKVVNSCTDAAECGQVLTGTSCGCTQDWVANLDADTTCFYAIIAQAEAIECELILASTCDCPPADGFVCNAGACGWNYL